MIKIGNSSNNIKKILIKKRFSNSEYKCTILNNHNYPDTFKTWFESNYLYVQRIDANAGWGHNHIGNIEKHVNIFTSDNVFNNVHFNWTDYILYFVHLTCTQDFNTGIQKVVRDLSFELNKKKKVILIKYNKEKKDYEVINDNELQIFVKYGGVNHYNDGYNFEKLSSIYNKIKNEENILIIPEIFYSDQYELFNIFFQLAKDRKYIITHIYYDDTIFYNKELDKNHRELWFNEYIKTISVADNIIPISFFSEKTYQVHKKRLNLNTIQNIIPIQLGIIDSLDKMFVREDIIISNISKTCEDIIISNISKTERKNYTNLIDAFNLIRIIKPNLKLIIFGHGWENEIDAKNNIEYKNFVSDKEKEYLYRNCLFTVYPSLKEGYGIPIYESLMYGKAVICHYDSSTLEIANDINQPCVSAIDCTDVNCLFQEMKKFCTEEYLTNAQKCIKNVKFKTNKEYGEEFINSIQQKCIFYYIDHTCQSSVRTGVQNYSISFAKELIKKHEVVFVKWDESKCSLSSCNFLEINHFFNYGVKNHLNLDKFKHFKTRFEIHKKYNLKDYVFICPEPSFLTTYSFQPTNEIFQYLKFYNLYNVFVVYDLIPILIDGYNNIKDNFTMYLNNLIQADKIICISEKTKEDLINYYSKFGDYNWDIDHILLPYQFRNVEKVTYKVSKNDCVKILLSGTIEPRKQQIKLMTIFNKLLSEKDYNVKLSIFGSVTPSLEKEFQNQLNLSNKIEYLGHISDDQLIDLYKEASFSCFISKYEGYGLPVAESLWMKTPVLCSNIEPLTQISKIGGCLLVDANDDNSIYLGLKKMIEDKQYRLQLQNEINSCQLEDWNGYTQKFMNKLHSTKIYFYGFKPLNKLMPNILSYVEHLNLPKGSWIITNNLYDDTFYNTCQDKCINIIFYKDSNINLSPDLLKNLHNINFIYVENQLEKISLIKHLDLHLEKLNNIVEKIHIFDNIIQYNLLKKYNLYKNIYNNIPYINEYSQSTEKLLSICISTYNREHWIKYTTEIICKEILSSKYKNLIEFIVVDNKSTDNSSKILKNLAAKYEFTYFINEKNVGMLPNLSITSQKTKGKYIWILGDDDIIKKGAIDIIVKKLLDNRNINLIYLNYNCTLAKNESEMKSQPTIYPLIDDVKHPNGIYKMNQMSTFNENLFTAIYCIIFRRDHGLIAYNQNIDNNEEFKDLVHCVPTTVYVLKNMSNYDGYWINDFLITVNLNCSWTNNGKDIIWNLILRPDMFDSIEMNYLNIDLKALELYRKAHINKSHNKCISLMIKDEHKLALMFDDKKYQRQIKHLT